MSLSGRLGKLEILWPRQPCDACRERPAVVCIPDEDTPLPSYPEGRCPRCGMMRTSVVVIIGVARDAI